MNLREIDSNELFFQNLITYLNKENNQLTIICSDFKSKIDQMFILKSQLIQSIYKTQYTENEFNIMWLSETSALRQQALKGIMDHAAAKVHTYNDMYYNCRNAIKLRVTNFVIVDEFTMKPFDDIQTEIDKIRISIISLLEKTKQNIDIAKQNCFTWENIKIEMDKYTESLESYRIDQKKQKLQLSQNIFVTKCFDALSYEKFLYNIKAEIADFESKINGL